jgi:hypothetical protein
MLLTRCAVNHLSPSMSPIRLAAEGVARANVASFHMGSYAGLECLHDLVGKESAIP